MSTELTVPVTAAGGELMISPKRLAIVAHNQKQIKDFVHQCLVPKHDFGTIEGCGDRQVLFQPGMQKIMSLANVYCDPDIKTTDLGGGHREFLVKTVLKQHGTDMPVATGMGSCSTMESKYRYRNADAVDTNQTLPRGYWDAPKDSRKGMLPPGTVAKRNSEGKWTIHKFTGDKVENPDLADQYNTCLKMAVKRSNMNAVTNMMGGWGEQFLGEDDTTPDAPPSSSQTAMADETTVELDQEAMKAEFDTWNGEKKNTFETMRKKAVSEGVAPADAYAKAYNHIKRYYQ